jgi:hypothetical protein
MNAEELKQFIESRGYMEVTVKDYANSCRIHYATSVDSITLNLKSKVADLPLSWLNNRFEPLIGTYTLSLNSKKKEGE